MSILSFKIRKFKSDFPRGKRLKIFLMEKASPPLRNLELYQKNVINKQWFQVQKHEKYSMSKNDQKKASRGLLFKSYEQISNFNFRKFKSDFPRVEWLDNFRVAFWLTLFDFMKCGLISVVFDGKGLSAPQKLIILSNKM